MFRKILSSVTVVCFLSTLIISPSRSHANDLLNLPEPGKMVSLSPAYNPAIIKGVTIHKDNPFLFDFIVDIGQDKLKGDVLK